MFIQLFLLLFGSVSCSNLHRPIVLSVTSSLSSPQSSISSSSSPSSSFPHAPLSTLSSSAASTTLVNLPLSLSNLVIDVQEVGVEGRAVSIPCNTTLRLDEETVSLVLWYKDGSEVPIYTLDMRDVNAPRHMPSGLMLDRSYFDVTAHPARLIIQNVTQSDEGRYKCRVDYRKARAETNSATVVVQFSPRVRIELGAKIDGETIREGTDVYFECIVAANPWVTEVSWFFEGQNLFSDPSSGVIISNQSLVLQRVQRHKRGRYWCTAMNRHGTGRSDDFFLRVLFAPVCKSGQTTTYGVARNELVMVSCDVDSDPTNVTFKWFFNDYDVRTEIKSFIVNGSHSRASYVPSSLRTFGKMICLGENLIGRQQEPCIFNIIPASPPEPVHNCSVRNQSFNSLLVVCAEGDMGGLKQIFMLQIYNNEHHTLFGNVSNEQEPHFIIPSLPPESKFMFHIYSINSKGRSNPVLLTAPSFTQSEKQTLSPSESLLPVPLTTTVLVMVALLTIIPLPILVWILKKNRSSSCNKEQTTTTNSPTRSGGEGGGGGGEGSNLSPSSSGGGKGTMRSSMLASSKGRHTGEGCGGNNMGTTAQCITRVSDGSLGLTTLRRTAGGDGVTGPFGEGQGTCDVEYFKHELLVSGDDLANVLNSNSGLNNITTGSGADTFIGRMDLNVIPGNNQGIYWNQEMSFNPRGEEMLQHPDSTGSLLLGQMSYKASSMSSGNTGFIQSTDTSMDPSSLTTFDGEGDEVKLSSPFPSTLGPLDTLSSSIHLERSASKSLYDPPIFHHQIHPHQPHQHHHPSMHQQHHHHQHQHNLHHHLMQHHHHNLHQTQIEYHLPPSLETNSGTNSTASSTTGTITSTSAGNPCPGSIHLLHMPSSGTPPISLGPNLSHPHPHHPLMHHQPHPKKLGPGHHHSAHLSSRVVVHSFQDTTQYFSPTPPSSCAESSGQEQ